MWLMPKLCFHSPHALQSPESSHKPLVVRIIRNGHSWPLLVAAAHKKFMFVATNYLCKWVEAEAYANIKDKYVSMFVWKNIICWFGILQAIIANNIPQFDSIAFRTFCLELKIKNSYSTLRYPQSNEQAEATNKTLLFMLKKRLEKAKGKWVDELLGVLLAYRMTPKRPTRTTPFALAYEMDVVILMEIGIPTTWMAVQGQRDEKQNLKDIWTGWTR